MKLVGYPLRSFRTPRRDVIVAVLLLGCACGGGGGRPSPAPTSACLSFGSSVAPAPDRVTCRLASGGSCDIRSVEVTVTVSNWVNAAGFTFTFDPTVVRYEGYSLDGSLLTADGTPVQVLEDVQAGRVSIGLTRIGPAGGVYASPTKRLVLLRFSRVADTASTRPLEISDGKLFNSATPPVEIPGMSWWGGSFQIQ